jgi:hypothetical protein
MKREAAAIVAIILAILVVATLVVYGPWSQQPSPFYNPEESLPHLAAPTEIPGDEVNATTVGDLSLSVTGSFYTMSPHISPTTFDFDLDIFVNNTGSSSIDDFQIVKVTIFLENATPVYTFGVLPEGNSTIQASSVRTLECENDRDMVTIPHSLMIASQIFARVLVTFNVDSEVILTTPMSSVSHVIE